MARLLLTNDDGIHGPGLHAMAAALARTTHDVVVVAPDHDASGTGAALGRFAPGEPVPVSRAELPGAEEVEAWALAGPPGMCVLAAMLEAFGEAPDVVVSGINLGLNTGRAILHSGTVGAALTAQNFGARGLAVSMAEADDLPWDAAADVALVVLDRVLDGPDRTVLNLNVPALPAPELGVLRWARLAPFGAVRAAMSGAAEGRLQFELIEVPSELPHDTDTALVAAGHPAVTAIAGVAEAWPDGALVVAPMPEITATEVATPGIAFSAAHLLPDPNESRHLHARAADR